MNAPTNLVVTIASLKSKIRSYFERQLRPTEDDTIRIFVLPLLAALGWDIEDLDEVKGQYRHKNSDNPVDFALCLQRSPVLFIEAKSLNENLNDRKRAVQTLNYANTAGVDWCVLTNGNEYRYYKTHAKGEIERKQFLTARIDDDTSPEQSAAKLALIGRDRMGLRDIDALWTNSRIDRQVQAAFKVLLEDDSMVRLIHRRTVGLKSQEIRDSLLRASILIDYLDFDGPKNDETLPWSEGRFPRTKALFDLGLLKKGMKLSIKDRPGSAAEVVDGNTVRYKGELLSFNVWGCRATGWSAIRIYLHAVTEDGQLLQDLRQKALGNEIVGD